MLSEALRAAIAKEQARRPQKIEAHNGGVYLGGSLLPKNTDDLTTSEWVQVLQYMENEPAIASCDFIIRAMTLECGWAIGTAVEEPTDKSKKPGAVKARRDYATAEEVRLFIEGMCNRLETGMDFVLWHAMSAWCKGHKLFEQSRDFVTQEDGASGVETVGIYPKPRNNYCFAVTRNFQLVGAVPEKGGLLLVDERGKLAEGDKFVPAEDLLVVSFRGEDGDPRGKPALRAAYDAWYRKQLAKPEAMSHLQLFGSGRYTIEAPLPTGDGPAPATTVTVNGTEYDIPSWLATQMPYMANNGWLYLPPGHSLKDHNPTQGGGQVFEQTFDRCDREMVTALLGVTRATMEAEFGSKADSGTAEGLLAMLINWLRKWLCEAIREQVFKPAVRLQFGDAIARKFTPKFLMHVVKEEDIAALLTAVSTAYTAGVVTDEQLPFWDRRLGQPERDVADTKDDGTDPKEKGPEFRKTRKSVPRQSDYAAHIRGIRAEIGSLCKQLQAGELSPEGFGDEFYKLLVEGHTDAWVLGRQRSGDLRLRGRDDEAMGRAYADGESEFLQDFIDKLSDPSIPAAQGGLYDADGNLKISKVTNRAKSYTGKMRATAAEAFVEDGADDDEYDWVMGLVEEHCSECPHWAANGPYTRATLSIFPGGGATPCLYNCECHLRRRRDGRVCYKPV